MSGEKGIWRRTAAGDQYGVDVVEGGVVFFINDVIFGDVERGFRVSGFFGVGFGAGE